MYYTYKLLLCVKCLCVTVFVENAARLFFFFWMRSIGVWRMEKGGGRFKYGISIFINVISARKRKKRKKKSQNIYIMSCKKKKILWIV